MEACCETTCSALLGSARGVLILSAAAGRRSLSIKAPNEEKAHLIPIYFILYLSVYTNE